PVDCYHANLEPILQETYGVIVYQEQVMQIAQVLSGFSLGGADLLRRAMAKKDLKKMDELRPKFVGGAKDRGYDPKLAETIWEVLVPFSSYAFNKSHSAAYATVAYQTAYLKAHYPAQFMAANMNSEMHDTTRLVVLLNDCRALGLEVLFPGINTSQAKFTVRDGKIVYGLGGIKNVGLSAVEKLVVERDAHGPFTTLFDLCKRVDAQFLNRRALESLILAGALDELPGNRARQFAVVETALAWAASFQEDRSSGQVSLFDMGSTQTGTSAVTLDTGEPPLPEVDAWPYNEMLEKEKEVLGLYLSGHPLEPYRAELESFATCPLEPDRLRMILGEPKEKPKEGERYQKQQGPSVVLGGMITKLKTRLGQKDNKTFAFADLQDFIGTVEVVFWSDVFEEVRHQVEIDSMVLIRGTLQRNENQGAFKLVASKVLPLAEAREKLTKSVHVRLRTAGLQEDDVSRIHGICNEYEGTCQFILHLECQGNRQETLLSEKLKISPESTFIMALSGLVGPENVWLSAKTY
ncbi:MAG TPA: OB-fold nucleic acid binding domain-containing protein, partial [Fibrobacteria bacterium]|nr:OB-fold nucleic acid binding domain-containing protein [Fibrobacteria bacterium]